MRRLFLWICLSVLPASLTLATTNYINNGVVSVFSPPGIAPQIDASNFVNNGIFYITNIYANDVEPPLPYQTWNTRNWTNANRMAGDTGFRFNYFDSVGQTNGWSANFQNSGNANPTNANIFGVDYVRVSATNINNKGTMNVGGAGLMTFNGRSLDLARGNFGAVGNETNDLAGVRDLYWGLGESTGGIFYDGTTVESPGTLVTTIEFPPFGTPFYADLFQFLEFSNPCGANSKCPNGFTAYVTTNQVFFNGAIQSSINVLFLRQTNAAISTDVRFGNFVGPGVDKIIQWQALQTNRVNGAVTTNRLFLEDSFGDWFFPPFLFQTPAPNFLYTIFAAARFRPSNYSLTHGAPSGYNTLPTLAPRLVDPSTFSGTNFPTLGTNTAWAATVTAAAFPPDPTITGTAWSNVPGRIEVTASGPSSSLDLTRAAIDGESYLLLNCTNHFVGCTNAVIVSPVSDFYLGSTNGTMAISNLTTPFVPRMEGVIQAWSGRWTNVTSQGVATLYTVTMVDSALVEKTPSQIQNLNVRSDNLLIGDALNVFGSLLLDTLRLTISTNAAHAPTPYGELNLTSGDLVWSPSFPRLQCLTNFGKITTLNSIYFAGTRTPPWFSGTFDEPYLSFVNHGLLISQGNSTWANYYEVSGTNNAGTGPISVQAGSAIATNGIFLATDADITLTCGSLFISNQVLNAGRSITLAGTNYLDDGSLSAGADAVTNRNTWQAGYGINLMQLPTYASLLATTVNSSGYPGVEVPNVWAGQDLGAVAAGYSNNAALGRLILDGGDDSAYFFAGPTANNALYVDYLECQGSATNFDTSGNLANLRFAPGMKIYYAQLIINGVSWAEKLNGKNGGGLNWVPSYAGTFSSTNLVYPDGTTNRLNLALVTSCDLDSNNNGIPNCLDPAPVLIPSQVQLAAVVTGGTNVALSWNGVPFRRNYLEVKQSQLGAAWAPLTNIFVPGPGCPLLQVTDRMTNAVPHRFYRVRVDAATP